MAAQTQMQPSSPGNIGQIVDAMMSFQGKSIQADFGGKIDPFFIVAVRAADQNPALRITGWSIIPSQTNRCFSTGG